jgi:phage tail-like protein
MDREDLPASLARGYPSPAFVVIDGAASWRRCDLGEAAIVVGDAVQLAWQDEPSAEAPEAVADPRGAGLAFDRQCRLFHSVPGEGRVERVLWGAFDARQPNQGMETTDIIGITEAPSSGDFAPATPMPPRFTPRALACDDADHLFVLDGHRDSVFVFDLEQRRLLRRASVPPQARDIAWHDGWLYGLSAGMAASLWRMSASRGLRRLPVNLGGLSAPGRLALDPAGRLFVLDHPHAADAALFEAGQPRAWRAEPRRIPLAAGSLAFASDLAGLPPAAARDDGRALPPMLVVARRRGETFVRLDLSVEPVTQVEPLTARAYDGMGIEATPTGRIAYWTAKGVRHAVASRIRYRPKARIVSVRLDSGRYQTVWGRILLDACIPSGAGIGLEAVVSDEESEDGALALLTEGPGRPLFRRTDGSEQPWFANAEGFATYEAPAPADRGRYLWVVLWLRGTAQATPKLRALRAERRGHDWLRRLPQLYSRNEPMRSFLQRYLAPAAGLIEDTGVLADTRHALLKPASVPAEVLPWLASWVGLALDERWSETARRTMLREAVTMFRLRGTVSGMRRMLEIVTGAPVVIIEKFRMRGLGRVGADGDGWDAPAILGHGLRVGGPVGTETATGEAEAIEDSFAKWAHRFTVMLLTELSDEQAAAIRHLLDVHRPAHTLVDVCTVGAGMRVGLGLQLELTSIVGRGSGWQRLQLGASLLGRNRVLGRPVNGISPGASRLGIAGSRLV